MLLFAQARRRDIFPARDVWRFVADKNKPKKKSDLLGEINSDIKIMSSNKQNVTLRQKIMVQDNNKCGFRFKHKK